MRRLDLPPREVLLRDGIPPAAMEALKDEAHRQRSAAIAAAIRRLIRAFVPARRQPGMAARLGV